MTQSHPGREPLTRRGIVLAALDLIDADGVDAFSMRRLGQALCVDAMAVYYHLPNKSAVFDGIVEEIWAGVRLPEVQPGESWQDVLRAAFSAFRARLLQHPRAIRLVGGRPIATAAMLRLVEEMLGRLEAAGLPAEEAMQLIDCLSGYTVGKTLADVAPELGGGGEGPFSGITPETHPNLSGALASGYVMEPEREFSRGLAALIDGWVVTGSR